MAYPPPRTPDVFGENANRAPRPADDYPPLLPTEPVSRTRRPRCISYLTNVESTRQ